MNWFNDNRLELFNRACELLLLPNLCGPLSANDMCSLIQIIESLNNSNLNHNMKNASKIFKDEMMQALVAEAVYAFDEYTVSTFMNGSEEEHIIDMDELPDDGIPSFVGDKLSKIPKMISDIIDKEYGTGGDNFIIASPLMLSILQSVTTSEYKRSEKNVYKGPNNTMLVGFLDDVPVYSYIFGIADFNEDSQSDTLIIGNYNPVTEKTRINTLTATNLTLV